jgi:hypothetical protein
VTQTIWPPAKPERFIRPFTLTSAEAIKTLEAVALMS